MTDKPTRTALDAFCDIAGAMDEMGVKADNPIAALIEADKHRTPGEWHVQKWNRNPIISKYHPVSVLLGKRELHIAKDASGDADAAFIAASANAMPAIVAMVEDNARMKSTPLASEAERAVVYGVKIVQLQLEIERLLAELAECRKDAERYRHMRARDNSLEARQRDKVLNNGTSCYHIVGGVRELKHGEELDAAIDAALAQQKGKEGGAS